MARNGLGSRQLPLVDGYQQDGVVGVLHHAVGDAAHQQALHAPLSMCGEHDHVYIFLLGHADDRLRRSRPSYKHVGLDALGTQGCGNALQVCAGFRLSLGPQPLYLFHHSAKPLWFGCLWHP